MNRILRVSLVMLLASATGILSAQEVVLENQNIKAVISCREGGKITSFVMKSKGIDLTSFEENSQLGLAKEQLYHGVNRDEFSKYPFEKVAQDKNSVTLQAKGRTPPLDRINLVKTYTLLDNGLKVEATFENTEPVAGAIKIIPWVHNVVKVSPADGKKNVFLVSGKEGIHPTAWDSTQIQSTILPAEGNWCAFFNKEKGAGLLLASSPMPVFFYSWIGSEDIGTLEMLYPEIQPLPSYKIIYYLLPVSSLDNKAIQSSGLEVALSPPLPEQETGLKFFEKKTVSFNEVNNYYNSPAEGENLVVKYYNAQTYLSPDIIAPTYFAFKSEPPEKGFPLPQVTFEMPATVTLADYCAGIHWIAYEYLELLSKTPVTRDGQPYIRYTFSVSVHRYNYLYAYHIRLFLSTGEKEGKFNIYYWGTLNGKTSAVNTLPVEIVRIPPIRPPKRFMVGTEGTDYILTKYWPEFAKNLRYLGFNQISITHNLSPVLEGDGVYYGKNLITVEEVKSWLERLREEGFEISSVCGRYFYPPCEGNVNPDVKALDIEGKLTEYFDFTSRGPWIKDVIKLIEEGLHLGFDSFLSDYEPYLSGDRISFTERTVKMFREYFQENWAGLEYVEPLTIAKNPGKYPEQEKIWIDFKCRQFADYLAMIINQIKKDYPRATFGLNTFAGNSAMETKRQHLEDLNLLAETLDFMASMVYSNYGNMPLTAAKHDWIAKEVKGKKAKYIPTISSGEWGNPNLPPEENKYIILEAVTSGAKGYFLWNAFGGVDILDLMYVSQANNIISQVEDVLYDGKRDDSLVKVVSATNLRWNLPARIQPKTIMHKDEMVVYFADYYSTDDVEVVLKSAVEGRKYQVIDLDTGREISKDGSWKTTLTGKERGKIFHLIGK
ncbi:MAG: hypothetical protein ABII89_04495 [Candidatus Omnitrophota bacterium]